MSDVRPFRGLRPTKELAKEIASPPYDVLSSDEAREIAKDKPLSFLHVGKPEIDLPPDIDIYSPEVYEKGKENFRRFIENGYLVQDPKPYYYLYRQIMGEHSQIGLVAGASIEEYDRDLIKKHELTRKVKEDDRTRHIDILNSQTGPVFLTYRRSNEIDEIVSREAQKEPDIDFVADDGIQHTLWVVREPETINEIMTAFKKVPALYVADGHHRSASASRVQKLRKEKNPNHTGNEEYNYFLAVIFPDNQLKILDYNRVVKDLNGRTKEAFLEEVSQKFDLVSVGKEQYKPKKQLEFGMFLDGEWFKLNAKEGSFDSDDPVAVLDVSILLNNLLDPVLGIKDPRTDERIDFIGGIRGLGELEKRVNSGKWAVAFAMFPTTVDQLMAIADAGKMMPPKSTWFEPKLRDAMVIHMLD